MYIVRSCFCFNDTATTEIYTLSLHDALPISAGRVRRTLPDLSVRPALAVWPQALSRAPHPVALPGRRGRDREHEDRKSTRLNSSHANISYAVFCLKKKKPHRPA